LPSLEKLNLNETKQLKSLPAKISQLTSLKFLSLVRSGVTSIPTEIGFLTHLCSLKLADCATLRTHLLELTRQFQKIKS
jgi:Leucine-rich repeat (LRR) protein